jgi:hypothetical protein
MKAFKVNLPAVPTRERRKIAEAGITREGFDMLMKIGGLARAIAIFLAIVAGFMALNMMNVPLTLVVLGLIAGLSLPAERVLMSTVTLIALPIIGTALTTIPTVGTNLAAICGNLQMAIAGSLATVIAMRLYAFVMEGVMGLTGTAAAGTAAAAAR